MKELTFFEKVEALKEGKTLVYDKKKQYYDAKKNMFNYCDDYCLTPLNLEFNWQIEEPKEPEYMTRLEVLEFVLSDDFKGRVVRYREPEWYIAGHFTFENPIEDYEHALLKDGQISDIRKFVK